MTTIIPVRPRPPAELLTMSGLMVERFVPAPEVLAWVQANYLDDAGPLYWPDHVHLRDAHVGILWTNVENTRLQRRVLGQAELVSRAHVRMSPWQRGRAEMQLRDWFGELPDFLITLDAVYCEQADDASFCALVDHELCHCAQKRDEYGSLEFERLTGRPKFTLRGHDVEEFVSVVSRFGIEAAGERAVDLVLAAAAGPSVARVKVAAACGTCLRLAA